ncbi:MAG: type II toxin-antitoxin system RelE/ParE family toxin [Terracidiphilus sp.]
MAQVLVRARARRDILSNAAYLEEHGGEQTAQRFLDATQSTFDALAKMPKLGVLCAFQRPVPSPSSPLAGEWLRELAGFLSAQARWG